MRSGRDPISQPLLVQIGKVFGGSTTVQSLILHYLLIEAPRRYRKRRTGATTAAFTAVPYKVRWRVRHWLAQLDAGDTPQRGLYLTGADAALLTAAAKFVVHEAEQQGRTCIVIRANDRITTSHANAALDATLVVFERVEFASASVARLIHARSDALRPIIATSCGHRDTLPDAHLVRVFRAWTTIITVSAPHPITHRRHAARS